jgi:hypothetical protein
MQSPEIRLIDAVEAVFQDGKTPRVDLPAVDETLLRALASKVPRRVRGGDEERIVSAEEAA